MSEVSLKLEDHGRAALHQLALTDERQIRHEYLGCISRNPLDEKRKKRVLNCFHLPHVATCFAGGSDCHFRAMPGR